MSECRQCAGVGGGYLEGAYPDGTTARQWVPCDLCGITRVVNIRSGEPYDVYIGRAGRGQSGAWGNPFRLSPGEARGVTIERYRAWLRGEVMAGRITIESLASLHGKVLGCFCKPAPCHGDVLAEAAAWAARCLTPASTPKQD